MRFKVAIISLILTSCEGIAHITGTVTDKSTKKAIPQANVTCINSTKLGIPTVIDSLKEGSSNQYTIITDSLGKFEMHSGFMGFVFGVPKFKLKIQKDGYKDKKIKGYGDFTVELEGMNNE
jgi:hypothetical protein